MKKDFFTGMALLMPLVLTIAIVVFIIKLITTPLMGSVSSLLNYLDILNKPFLFLKAEQVLALSSRLLILIGLFGITTLVGVLARLFLFEYLGRFSEYLIHRTPLVNKIYKAVQDVVKTVFSKTENSFSEVVLVPFPHGKAKSIGLVTRQAAMAGSDDDYLELVSVFVPGTPNPSMGFMLLYRRDQLTPIDMKVKDALKFLVSCGVVAPETLPKTSNGKQ